jgi:hypothetical protein
VAESVDASGLPENAKAARVGGGIARRARQELESQSGRSVVSGENFLPPSKQKKRLKP